MERDLADGLGGDEEADGEVGEGGELEAGGIADGEGSGGDGDGGASAEGEGAGGGGVDGIAAGAEGDVGRADGEGVEAELVADDDADGGAAEGDVDDLAVGGVGCAVLGVGIFRATGAAAQVPTQWSGEAAAAGLAVRAVRERIRRARKGSVLVRRVMTVLW